MQNWAFSLKTENRADNVPSKKSDTCFGGIFNAHKACPTQNAFPIG
jgi:hypothetical protein